MEYTIQQKIDKLSKMNNYFRSKKAIKIISTMTAEELEVVLSNSKVQEVIFKINDTSILREIFNSSVNLFSL